MSNRTTDDRPAIAIEGGRIVTASRAVTDGTVVIRGAEIAAIDPGTGPVVDRRIDATGRLVLPGLVDLHGDDIEQQIEPRTGATFDPEVALLACDRSNLAAGITTKFDAIAFENSPAEHRSIRRANAALETIDRSDRLLVDHHVHARCELTDAATVDAVIGVLDHPVVDLVSLMRHVPGTGQFDDRAAFEREYVTDGDWSTGEARQVATSRRSTPTTAIEARVDRVIERARISDVPVASHDDEDAETVEKLAERGVGMSEYPTTLSAARRASELGLDVAMGAPNLVRGGSLWDNLDARRAIISGVVDVLCSDYHPPSLLNAAVEPVVGSLVDTVARVTASPAAAAGLDDRGRLEPGRRADVIVVDPGPPPVVEHAFVAGEQVYRAGSVDGGPPGAVGTNERAHIESRR